MGGRAAMRRKVTCRLPTARTEGESSTEGRAPRRCATETAARQAVPALPVFALGDDRPDRPDLLHGTPQLPRGASLLYTNPVRQAHFTNVVHRAAQVCFSHLTRLPGQAASRTRNPMPLSHPTLRGPDDQP